MQNSLSYFGTEWSQGTPKSTKDPLYLEMPDNVHYMVPTTVKVYINDPIIRENAQYVEIEPGNSNPYSTSGNQISITGGGAFRQTMKYDGEEKYRYLFASDLSWRTEDILQIFTLRWLVEVFFQDWKAHEGWGNLTKLQGDEGSSWGLILSLLVDHCLLTQPDQLAQLKRKQPVFTVGSLINRIKVECLLDVIHDLLSAKNPEQELTKLADTLTKQFALMPSRKHMVGRDLGRQEPTPSLKYKAIAMAT